MGNLGKIMESEEKELKSVMKLPRHNSELLTQNLSEFNFVQPMKCYLVDDLYQGARVWDGAPKQGGVPSHDALVLCR